MAVQYAILVDITTIQRKNSEYKVGYDTRQTYRLCRPFGDLKGYKLSLLESSRVISL